EEGTVVLTCHHVVAPVKPDNLCVRIPQADGQFGEPLPVRYDEERPRPEKDAVVLRVQGVRMEERPLLHKLDLDKYNGRLNVTVLTHLRPNNSNAEVRPSAWLNLKAPPEAVWTGSPERYE